MIYVSPPKWPITQTAIAWRQEPPKKKLFHKFTCCYTSVPIYGLKFRNFRGGLKKFDNFLTSQKSLKIGTFWPRKRPIGDLFENPNQGV